MQEAKMSFETGVAQCDTGDWCWAARGRDLQGSDSIPVSGIHIRPRLEEYGAEMCVAFLSRPVQGRAPVLVGYVNVSTLPD